MPAEQTPVIDLDADVIEEACRRTAQRFRVALPAAALTYDRDTSRLSAQPMVRFVAYNLQPVDEPAAVSLPVMHYAGGGYGCWFDLREKDPTVLLACDGPVLGYFSDGQMATPRYGQAHTYGCAVAFPGGRISSSSDPTPPPNSTGECLLGAADGSACVTFRGAGITSPTELGTVVITTAGPTASLRLGGDTATLGVHRIGDASAPTANMQAFMSAVAAFVNGIAPGTVSPAVLASILISVSNASEGSTKVVSL